MWGEWIIPNLSVVLSLKTTGITGKIAVHISTYQAMVVEIDVHT